MERKPAEGKLCNNIREGKGESKGKFTLMTEIDHWITARGASIKGLFRWKQGVLDKNEKSLNCILLGHTQQEFSHPTCLEQLIFYSLWVHTPLAYTKYFIIKKFAIQIFFYCIYII